MRIIEVWETKDGETFKSITEARAHEEREKYLPEIRAFIASDACKYNNNAHKTIVEKIILAWISWKTGGGKQ